MFFSTIPEQDCVIVQETSLLLAGSCASNTGISRMSLSLPTKGSRISSSRQVDELETQALHWGSISS